MRIALVVLALLAIVLPTALIPETASAHANVYSVGQVLRVFEAAGIPLHRSADDSTPGSDEAFVGGAPHHLKVSAYVYAQAPTQFAYGWTGTKPPKLSQRGNVIVVWTAGKRAASADLMRVRAALQSLRYSQVDAARPQLPTVVLHPGQADILGPKTTTPGTEVECINGSANANHIVGPTPANSLTLTGDSGTSGSAILRWEWVSSTELGFSCEAAGNTIPLEGRVRLGHAGSARLVCSAKPSVVRSVGLLARVPPGWYSGSPNEHRTLTIGNEPRCAAPTAHGISLTIHRAFTFPSSYTGHSTSRFAIPSDAGTTLLLWKYGVYADAFLIGHGAYTVAVHLGKAERDGDAIRAVEEVLANITPLAH